MSTQTSLADYPPIFIGGLPSCCDWQEVYNYLQQFGEIKSLLVPRYKRTGRIKGYAKARYAKLESIDLVLAQPEHIIGGLRVGIFLWKSKSEYAPVMDELRARMVHVKYEFQFSESQLMEYFSKFGPVQMIEMPYNPITKELRNFSYVVFSSPRSAFIVAQIRNHFFLENPLVCEMSRRIHFGYTQGQDAFADEGESLGQELFSHQVLSPKFSIVKSTQTLPSQGHLTASQKQFAGYDGYNFPMSLLLLSQQLQQAKPLRQTQNRIQGFWFKPTTKLYHISRQSCILGRPSLDEDNNQFRINFGAHRRWD
jgi:RNA recognition motif-containing protein